MVVINGNTAGPGAGILVEGRPDALAVTLSNVEVRDNSTTGSGGGVGVLINGPRVSDGSISNLILFMDEDSSIDTNTAQGNGGGLVCLNAANHNIQPANLLLLDRVAIRGNEATNGGGLAAENCRHITYASGGTQTLIFLTGGIGGNTATESGGGVYVSGLSRVSVTGVSGTSSEIPMGDPNAGRIFLNQASNGGGVYVTGPSAIFTARETIVDNNSASVDGGGLYVTDGATAEVIRAAVGTILQPCQPQQSSSGVTTIPRCSRLRDNSAGRDGGAAFVDGAKLESTRTIISGNEADGNGSVVAVRGSSEAETGEARLDDSLVYGNHGNRLFYAWTHSDILVRWSTITDNNSPGSVFRAFTNTGAARVRIASSIIWEEAGNLLTIGGNGDLTAFGDCVIGHQDLAEIDASINFYSTSNPLLFEKD